MQQEDLAAGAAPLPAFSTHRQLPSSPPPPFLSSRHCSRALYDNSLQTVPEIMSSCTPCAVPPHCLPHSQAHTLLHSPLPSLRHSQAPALLSTSPIRSGSTNLRQRTPSPLSLGLEEEEEEEEEEERPVQRTKGVGPRELPATEMERRIVVGISPRMSGMIRHRY